MFKVNNKGTRTTPMTCSSVSVVKFEQVNADWERKEKLNEMIQTKINRVLWKVKELIKDLIASVNNVKFRKSNKPCLEKATARYQNY